MPAVGGRKQRRHGSRQRSAKRRAGEREDDGGALEAARRKLSINGTNVGEDAADAQSRKEPQCKKMGERRCKNDHPGEQPEHYAGKNDGRATAVAVPDVAEQRRADENSKQAGAEDWPEHAWVHQPPLFRERRYGKCHDRNVVPIEQQDYEGQHNKFDVEAAETALIEQLCDVYVGSPWHKSSLCWCSNFFILVLEPSDVALIFTAQLQATASEWLEVAQLWHNLRAE